MFVSRTDSGARLSASLTILVSAMAAALLAIAGLAAAAGAATLTLTPSTTQAAGHPNLTGAFDARSGGGSTGTLKPGEGLKTLSVALPAGTTFDPSIVTTRCTISTLPAADCPTASRVGAATATIVSTYRTVKLSGYLAVTSSSSAVDGSSLVAVFNPSGAPRVVVNLRAAVSVATDGTVLTTLNAPSIPASVQTSGGLFPATGKVAAVSAAFTSSSSTSAKSGITLPPICSSLPSTAIATTTGNRTITASTTLTPTGCASIPFAPNAALSPNQVVSPSGGTGLGWLTTGSPYAAIANAPTTALTSAVSGPYLYPNFLSSVATCVVPATTDALASACPAASVLGSLSFTTSVLDAGAITGAIVAESVSPTNIGFAAELRSASGRIWFGRGAIASSSANGGSSTLSLSTLPQLPLGSLKADITSRIFIASTQCGSFAIANTFNGAGGKTATGAGTYESINCGAYIFSGPPEGSFTADANPELRINNQDRDGLNCSIDAGAPVLCGPPYSGSMGSTVPQIYWYPGPLSEGAHTLTYKGVHCYAESCVLRRSFTVDATPPVVSISSPASGSTITSNTVTFTGTATDALSGVASTTRRIDANPFQAWDPAASEMLNLSNGTHTITARATDVAGNIAESSTTFVVDGAVAVNPVPQVSISSPTSGQIMPTLNVPVQFTATDNDLVSVRCILYPQASYAIIRNNCVSGDVIGAAYNSTATQIRVEATDSAGQVGSANVTFATDTIPPQVQINGVVGLGMNASPYSTFQVDIFSHDYSGAVTLACTWDGVALASCPDPIPVTGSANGTHTLTLTATDLVGLSTTVAQSIVVDNTRPLVRISSPSGYFSYNIVPYNFTYGSTAAIASVMCSRDGGALYSCVSGASATVPGGSHTFRVEVTDVNGVKAVDQTSFTTPAACPPGMICVG